MSVGGLLSGRMPGELDRDGFFFGSYGDKNLFFPEIVQKAGIRTVSAHAHGYFKGTGLAQGFDAWEVVPDLKWSNLTDENVTSPALEQIAEKMLGDPALDKQRFFAWFHFVDPHDQYMAHEGIDWGPKLRDRYDAEITFTDRYIGKLIDFVRSKPFGARTAIIVTADHGEAFGEHKQYMHGFELWEPLVRVPLFFVVPGVRPHEVKANRSAIDLAPTVLDLLGLPPEPTFRGKSLVQELRADAVGDGGVGGVEERDLLVDLPQTSDNDRRRALVSGRKKLIVYGLQEYAVAYDLEADPEESKPLVSGALHDELLAKYKQMTKDVQDVPPTKCKEGCLAGGYAKAAADAAAEGGP
jgi:arylsulfatase A-like enzyme